MASDYLEHHGIPGQKWGQRNGPPYPLKEGAHSQLEKRLADPKHDIDSKRTKSNLRKIYEDQTVPSKASYQTVTYNTNRIGSDNYFYATPNTLDKHKYRAQFGSKTLKELGADVDAMRKAAIAAGGNPNKFTENTRMYKTAISTKSSKDIRVASEETQYETYSRLMRNDNSFRKYVLSTKNGMSSMFDGPNLMKRPAYVKGFESLDNMRKTGKMSDNDLYYSFRIFNFVLPADSKTNPDAADKQKVVRDKFFSELANDGFSAILDTNDALYNSYKSTLPVIVIQPTEFSVQKMTTLNAGSVAVSKVINGGAMAVEKILGRR